MIQELTIETDERLTGVEAEILSVNARAMELRAENPQAALDWLNQSEHLVEQVSITRQGRFHNQRALALEALKEFDRAILAFDRAAYCFEQSGEIDLQAMIHNNLASVYACSGNFTRAHESVDLAIRLAPNQTLLAQWADQKAICYLQEGRLDEAETQADIALKLALTQDDSDVLAECVTTKNRIAQQKDGACGKTDYMLHTPNVSPPPFSLRGEDMPSTPLECATRIIRDNHDLALPLLSMMALIADPNGDPERFAAADEAMQYLCVHTPQGEQFCRSLIDSLANAPQEMSDVSS